MQDQPVKSQRSAWHPQAPLGGRSAILSQGLRKPSEEETPQQLQAGRGPSPVQGGGTAARCALQGAQFGKAPPPWL